MATYERKFKKAHQIDGLTLHQSSRHPSLRYYAARSDKGRPIPVPRGYKTIISKRTGLPMLKKK